MITNSLNLNINVQFQKIVWLALPLFCILIIFFIGSVAETNRAPFDLAVSWIWIGKWVYDSNTPVVIFVFFFLAEYASIVLMCIFTSILFLGGYLLQFDI